MSHLRFSLFVFGYVLVFNCNSQILIDSYYSKVLVERGEERIIGIDSVRIDTLVLKDRAKLRFAQNSILVVKNAFIGNKCELNSSGSPGLDGTWKGQLEGGNGEDGKSLTLIIDFKELGSLSINTNGGRGGRGVSGRPGLSGSTGSNGEDGQSGGGGGDAGHAGNLTLIYSSEGFVPIFQRIKHEHSIQLNYFGGEAGEGGRGGLGGKGGRPLTRVEYINGVKRIIIEGPPGKNGFNGSNGTHGKGGKDGELILKRRD